MITPFSPSPSPLLSVGLGRAMDMILTGRPVHAQEALQMGLVSSVFEKAQLLPEAIKIAKQIASFPQACMRSGLIFFAIFDFFCC